MLLRVSGADHETEMMGLDREAALLADWEILTGVRPWMWALRFGIGHGGVGVTGLRGGASAHAEASGSEDGGIVVVWRGSVHGRDGGATSELERAADRTGLDGGRGV